MLSSTPQKNFVLRNNDLGDVLVSTPLISGLRLAFPNSKVCVGVGDWAKPLLSGNPNIDEIISCNAPWHNKQNCRYPGNSPKTFLEGLYYVLFSKEAKYIARKKFTHGFDVLGSRQGSWLMLRAGIQHRFGVRGYAGGDNWCEKYVKFDENRKVADAAITFLKLIGASEKIEPRPQIFLNQKEKEEAKKLWGIRTSSKKRIVIAPGGGFPEKCWGDEKFTELIKLLNKDEKYQIFILGSVEDKSRIKIPGNTNKEFKNLCGELSLRQSAAIISESDFVITNSSLSMHLAGAFKIPSLTLLGDSYDSANLHHKQWGYPEGIVSGKEVAEGKLQLPTPITAKEMFNKSAIVNNLILS